MWEKLSTYTLDVSKYILTGVVIASMFKEFADKTVMYIVGIIAAILFLVAGLIFYQKSDKEKVIKTIKKGENSYGCIFGCNHIWYSMFSVHPLGVANTSR